MVSNLVDTVDTLESLGMIANGMNVLDVGCFIGSWGMTFKAKGYEIDYVGLDVSKISLAKARNRMPYYKFIHIDVNNITYNPLGKVRPLEAKFPVKDSWADLVICHSLFTHLGKLDYASHYINEIKRCMKPKSYIWITFFQSPPNQSNYGTKRTVFECHDIDKLLEGFTIIYSQGGETISHHDQLMIGAKR